MLFNSYEFLFVFLPAVIVGYFAIARRSARGANAFLAAASVAFYAWWKLDFVWILAASIAANYLFGHKLSRDAATPSPLGEGGGEGRRPRALLTAGMTATFDAASPTACVESLSRSSAERSTLRATSSASPSSSSGRPSSSNTLATAR